MQTINRNIWDYSTVGKQMSSDSFKKFSYKLFTYKSLYIYIQRERERERERGDLALNNQQELIYHKHNQTKLYSDSFGIK